MVEMEEMEEMVVMEGLDLGLVQKLPSRLLGKMAAAQCRTCSCCAPSSNSPALPKLHPSCSSPSSSLCHRRCHS